MFFNKKMVIDKEYSVKTDYLDTKEIANYKLLDIILKDILLSYNICYEIDIDGVLLKEMRKIKTDILNINVFYENWNFDKTKYTLLVEIEFYERKLKYQVKKIILKRQNELLLQKIQNEENKEYNIYGKKIKFWSVFKGIRKGLVSFLVNLLEIKEGGGIFRPWQSYSSKKIKKYSHLSNKYYNKKDYEKSLYYIGKWLRFDRKNAEIYKIRGLIKEKMNDYIGAKEDYDVSMIFGLEGDIYLRYYRGRVNDKMKIFHEAKEDYKPLAEYLKKIIIPVDHIDIYLNNIRF